MLKSCFQNRAEKAAAFDAVDVYPVISSEFCLDRPVPEVFLARRQRGSPDRSAAGKEPRREVPLRTCRRLPSDRQRLPDSADDRRSGRRGAGGGSRRGPPRAGGSAGAGRPEYRAGSLDRKLHPQSRGGAGGEGGGGGLYQHRSDLSDADQACRLSGARRRRRSARLLRSWEFPFR